MMRAGVKKRLLDDSTAVRKQRPPYSGDGEFGPLESVILGVLYVALWITVPLAILYGLVKFVQWAWEH
jgi:hypothetical protein